MNSRCNKKEIINKTHPRLLYNREWIDNFRKEIRNNEILHRMWDRILEEADKLLLEEFVPEIYADEPDTQHGNYGKPGDQIGRMAMVLGLAYQVTGDEKYAQKLKEGLFYYATYRKWHGRGLFKNDPPWHSELNTARFCYGFAVGYDSIYNFLNADERETVRNAMIKLGILPILNDWILPEQRIHALDSMGHNWWSVCVAEAGLATLSIVDDELKADRWLDEIIKAFPLWFSYKGHVLQNKCANFDEKGGLYESVGYCEYAIYEYLLFRKGYVNTYSSFFAFDIPYLKNVCDFFLNTFYPSSLRPMTVNFGDGYIYGNVGRAVKMLLANGFDDPRLRWYLKEAKPKEEEIDILFYDKIYKGPVIPPEENKKSVFYSDIGWSIIRTSWKQDATLLAIKCGFTWNHAHADAGSFILFHAGKPLIIDSGNCSYGRPEYQQYYCQSHAHNVVLFNGNAQNDEDIYYGVKEPGKLYNLIEQGDLRYIFTDSAGPTGRYFSRNFRHFLWIGGVILILDDIRAHEAGKIELLLHYDGEGARAENGDIVITNENAKVVIRSIFPKDISVKEKEGFADHDVDRKVLYYALSSVEEKREEKFMTAIIPINDAAGEMPRIEAIEGPEVLGVRIYENDKVTDVYWNLRADGRRMHRNTCNIINGFDTDTYILAITRPKDSAVNEVNCFERCFIAGGSYLRIQGKILFSSLSKAFTVFTWLQDKMIIELQGQKMIDAMFYAPIEPSEVWVNGKKKNVEYIKSKKVIRFEEITLY